MAQAQARDVLLAPGRDEHRVVWPPFVVFKGDSALQATAVFYWTQQPGRCVLSPGPSCVDVGIQELGVCPGL